MSLTKVEFDQRVDELRKKLDNNVHYHIFNELIELYHQNNDAFPNRIVIDNFYCRRVATVKDILVTLGCDISNYTFTKHRKTQKTPSPLFSNEPYINYQLIIHRTNS